jgi:hypothetical protein
VIQWASINGLNVGRSPQEAPRVLDVLQTDELCPWNWGKGKATHDPRRCPKRPDRRAFEGHKMSIEALRDWLPDYAKDLRLNLGTFAAEPSPPAGGAAGLSPRRSRAAMQPTTEAIIVELSCELGDEELAAAKAAAAITGPFRRSCR